MNWLVEAFFACFGVYLAFTAGAGFTYAVQQSAKRRLLLLRLLIGLLFVGFAIWFAEIHR
jgi:hypothetical protein